MVVLRTKQVVSKLEGKVVTVPLTSVGNTRFG